MATNLKNAFYAQSGGVTAVINATAASLILAAREKNAEIGKVFAGKNGIVGALKDELIDTSTLSDDTLQGLLYTPGGAFGSCRYKLKDPAVDDSEYRTLIETFKKYHIGYFFYNGGNDSQDTALKIARYCEKVGFDLQCIGIPKTIDNDLVHTDNCPGFGSVAKFVATTIRECALDVKSMAATSTQIFIMEVMGRHAGWIAAASGLAAEKAGDAPHIILFPEIAFDPEAFYAKVHQTIKTVGSCAIVVSEGIKNEAGRFIADSGVLDAFGHHQLGGVGEILSSLLSKAHGYKCHFAKPDYLQRAARHLASQVDFEQACAMGRSAIDAAIAGKRSVMLTIVREQNSPYQWHIGTVNLSEVANQEKSLPRDFVTPEGFGITEKARQYLSPLIQGESYPPYHNGLPHFVRI
jgi:6-phosphofructokinase